MDRDPEPGSATGFVGLTNRNYSILTRVAAEGRFKDFMFFLQNMFLDWALRHKIS